ncbi:Outer membrane receptor proteins, mostly Fe transport [Pseudoxanthomonas sp. GM95]|uniref:TonB-dependent receptor family protein n=1 Tax=Pseudoxanthomonas sp. GM95 TaxID=1881043 RepID=UPI0008D5C57D|nr:TonB-dependent receptor [Pseudoxanthomonas sp. GM95]SEM23878.1 Outer membrane receptor proteins, mostly Fe transport [Pseudoxanthomonas sp. GM95]
MAVRNDDQRTGCAGPMDVIAQNARVVSPSFQHGRLSRRALFSALALALLGESTLAMPALAADVAVPGITTLPTLDVVGVSPSGDATLAADKSPYPVRGLDADQLDRMRSVDLTAAMDRSVPGITLNSVQGNPLQPDVQFRGFTGSPLLGIAQGIAVYQDGVRVNEIFGDTVNWDLLPQQGIDRLDVVTGANPVFGLNTLGGAIVLRSKNGFDDQGTQLSYEGGSFGREVASVESGGNNGAWGYYVLADNLYEQGWRDLSPSHARHYFANVGWHGERATLDLSLAKAKTDLTGNGAQSIEQLQRDRESIFTAPDETANDLTQATLRGSFHFNDDTVLSAMVYDRKVDTRSFNGDGSEAEECEADDDILCEEEDDEGNQEVVTDQNGNPISSEYDAVNNIGKRRQRAHGGNVQLVFSQDLAGHENQLVVGGDFLSGNVRYASIVAPAVLLEDRSTSRDSGLEIPEDALDVYASTRTYAWYATDTFNVTDALALTVSARYNETRTRIADQSGENPDLNGNHVFSRLNPAAGLAWKVNDALTAYGSYSESTRAPTPVELTCSDEDAPCKLPNQFISDPPLNQVVAKSWEAGLRGKHGDALRWQAGVFRTTSHDDILFQTTGGTTSNEGFFANVGDTRRQGLELSAQGSARAGVVEWSASYVWLDATYQDGFQENAANNPTADDDGLITVQRGDRIPGLPRHQLKAAVDVALTPTLRVGLNAQYRSSQYLRGDESNDLPQIAGYALFGLQATWDVTPRLQLSARIENLTDKRYASFGTLGEPDEIFPGDSDPRFLGPGAPRGGWVGARYRF